MSSRSAHATEPTSTLTGQYPSTPAGFDELIDSAGAIRPHWAPLLAELEALAPEMRALRLEQINAKVRETGIAHDLYADPGSLAQPWRIDLVPLIIPAEEWRWLERALVQRARLTEALLGDLYGPQRLLASGAIPHQLVLSDPAYLRPCRNLTPARGFIQFLAADLARSPDGRWRVIDTHAETPAGIGYALANRMVHTNIAGDIFAAAKALRQAPFFERLRAELVRRANRPDPAIALLTPGPHHNDFFSHAYLARYLGLLLVEGGDLRVTADGCVALKTLHGLMPIDLIVRCISGAASDPLELEADFAGPVGLLQAVRRQPDLAANALGAALAENRGLSAYLPQLARTLLKEELLLEDGQRWWLGDPGNRTHVAANLEHVVIRPAHEGTARPGRAVPGIDPTRLSTEERAALLQHIALNGAALVAEAKTGFGTTPSLTAAGLVPKPYALRLFVAATDGGFAVLPGGLAMTVDPERTVALSAPDGESRDVWIVDEAPPAPHVSLWRPTVEAARIRRPLEELPSRAAENLFWLGRYAERADWSMRMLRTCLSRLQEDHRTRQSLPACRIALELLLAGDAGVPLPGSRERSTAPLIERLAGLIMTSGEQPLGLPRLLDNLHRVAGITRDRLSSEAWRALNDFHATRCWRAGAAPPERGDALRQLDDGLRVLAAFNGLIDENFTRGHGWSFLDLGRRLARADGLAALLAALFGRAADGGDETGSLLFTLEVADSFITYRSRYRLEPMLPLLLDLLLVDESNPRGLAFQLVRISERIETLPQSASQAGAGGGSRMEEQRLALSLLTAVRLADVVALARPETGGARADLQRLLGEQSSGLASLPDAIGRRYFDLLEKGVKWVRLGAQGGAQGSQGGAPGGVRGAP
jgi:uncharacterized circularly permuted ATP-grasp superfamily protein/uncharacterized alpha-E superfamily protein